MGQAVINPDMMHWARREANLTHGELAGKLRQTTDQVSAWERGTARPTFKQAKSLANKLRIPFGYLFLNQPPVESLAIPDLRTVGNSAPTALSRNFHDLLNNVLLKQQWFREYQIERGEDKCDFIGRYSMNSSPKEVARDISATLAIHNADRTNAADWKKYLITLIEKTEAAGILVLRSGVVGSNNRRTLSVEEFRGFAITDDYAPLIFINAADAPAARLFTLAHELAHLWIGESGVSNMPLGDTDSAHHQRIEELCCNRVAAELLVPERHFVKRWNLTNSIEQNTSELRRVYKVSTLVLARRAYDAGLVPADHYFQFYQTEIARYQKAQKDKSGGGNYYATAKNHNSHRFSQAVIEAAAEGRLLLRDAARLLDIAKISTLRKYSEPLGTG